MNLDEPIKIDWRSRTLARRKIHDRNLDLTHERANLVAETFSREKSNVVIESVEEAEALASELNNFIGESGDSGRTWVNSSVDKSCQQRQSQIIEAMAERGFECRRKGATTVEFYREESLLVDPSDVLPGDLVRLNNDSIYRVVSRPREERDGLFTLRAIRHDGVSGVSLSSERVYLGDVVRHVDREDEEAIDQEAGDDEEPDDVSEEKVIEAVERAEEEGVDLDDVLPRGASTHIKKIPSGKKKRRYLYANYRENGQHKTKYLGPASRFGK